MLPGWVTGSVCNRLYMVVFGYIRLHYYFFSPCVRLQTMRLVSVICNFIMSCGQWSTRESVV